MLVLYITENISVHRLCPSIPRQPSTFNAHRPAAAAWRGYRCACHPRGLWNPMAFISALSHLFRSQRLAQLRSVSKKLTRQRRACQLLSLNLTAPVRLERCSLPPCILISGTNASSEACHLKFESISESLDDHSMNATAPVPSSVRRPATSDGQLLLRTLVSVTADLERGRSLR